MLHDTEKAQTPTAKDSRMHSRTNTRRPRIIRPGRLACALATLAAIGVAGFGASAAPALAETCANQVLRIENNSTRLPECRAYEPMTPAYKEGFTPSINGFSDDGALAYSSTGNFAGNGLGAPNNTYVATRSAAGWQTSAPSPSGPTYIDQYSGKAFAMSADLRSSIWWMRLADQPADVLEFFLRGPDGVFTRIGPSANLATLPPALPGPISFAPQTFPVGASADLSHFLFTLLPANGYPGDTSTGTATLYEYVGTGNERPQLVGVDNTGHQISQANTCSSEISTDGRVVFFAPGCGGQVWARINGVTSIEASASECTRSSSDPGGVCKGLADAHFAGAASDGSRVYFTSTQQLVNGDTDLTNDMYECDIPPGTPAPVGAVNPCESLTEVSGSARGADVESVVNVSEDGSRVYFVAKGVLAANLGTNDAAAVAGDNNLYVWQKDAAHPAGQTTFVAKLEVNELGFHPQTTADGRYLVFNTPNRLLPSDTDEGNDVYRYDADTGTLLRLSSDASGTGGNTPGFSAELSPRPDAAGPRWSITSDGATVVFETSEALSAADTNGQRDVYEWHDGQVALISSGRPYLESSNPGDAYITASGTDIYFNTTQQLTPGDTDTLDDVYDARVGGGFNLAKAAACSGEACQPAISAPPGTPGASGSATFNGPGNLATSSPPAPAAKPKPKPPTRAQKLAKALKACKAKHNKKQRSACETKARRSYGSSK